MGVLLNILTTHVMVHLQELNKCVEFLELFLLLRISCTLVIKLINLFDDDGSVEHVIFVTAGQPVRKCVFPKIGYYKVAEILSGDAQDIGLQLCKRLRKLGRSPSMSFWSRDLLYFPEQI